MKQLPYKGFVGPSTLQGPSHSTHTSPLGSSIQPVRHQSWVGDQPGRFHFPTMLERGRGKRWTHGEI